MWLAVQWVSQWTTTGLESVLATLEVLPRLCGTYWDCWWMERHWGPTWVSGEPVLPREHHRPSLGRPMVVVEAMLVRIQPLVNEEPV